MKWWWTIPVAVVITGVLTVAFCRAKPESRVPTWSKLQREIEEILRGTRYNSDKEV